MDGQPDDPTRAGAAGADSGSVEQAAVDAAADAHRAAVDRAAAAADRRVAAQLLLRSTALRQAAARDWERAALAQHHADLERTAGQVDELTGVLRRGSGYAALQLTIDHCRAVDSGLVIGFVDIDDMKGVNDTRGHEAGDRLLVAVARGLLDAVRPDDVVVRFGGDEFIFCMSGATLRDAIDRFAHLRLSLGRRNGSTISGGFAELRPDDTLEQLIARADADLYARRSLDAVAARTAEEPDTDDVIAVLTALTARCVDMLDIQTAGVLLADGQGGLRLMAASGEQAQLLARAEIEHGEGPCLEAYATGRPVSHPDLEVAMDRWPVFAPLAAKAGVRWAHAEPLRSRTVVSGTLSLFRTSPGTSPPVDLQMARTIADVVGMAVVQELAMRTMRVNAGRLRDALTSRGAIEQAKGMLAQHASIDINDASHRLHEHARLTSRRVSAVAEDIVTGTMRLDAVTTVTHERELP